MLKGIAFIIISAAGFSVSILTAKVAMTGGASVSVSNAIRYCLATTLLFIYQKAANKPLILKPRERYAALGLGISIFMMGIGYLAATQYIKVSLAVLIFYT